MANILQAFINIAKDIPVLGKPYSILKAQKIDLSMVITTSLDYGDKYDGITYLGSIKSQINPDNNWSHDDLVRYDYLSQIFIIGYKHILTIDNPSPYNVFKACSWCMDLTAQEVTVIKKVLIRLSMGRWNGNDTLNLDDGTYIPSIDGMYVLGGNDLLVNNVNMVIHTIISYYNDLLFVNEYRNTPFKKDLGLKDILTIFYPEADMSQALEVYGTLLESNDTIQLMDTWIGIFIHDYFTLHSKTSINKLIVDRLSIQEIIEMILDRCDDEYTENATELSVETMTRIYLIFAQHLRLNGEPKNELFDIKEELWIQIGDKKQMYEMKLYHPDQKILERYAQVFSFLEMLNLSGQLLLG
jgi:hypothetical protein